jgi:hypothetical protein
MKFVLFFAAIATLSGPGAVPPAMFNSQEACEKARAEFVKAIRERNTQDGDKVTHVAIACVPLKHIDQKAM